MERESFCLHLRNLCAQGLQNEVCCLKKTICGLNEIISHNTVKRTLRKLSYYSVLSVLIKSTCFKAKMIFESFRLDNKGLCFSPVSLGAKSITTRLSIVFLSAQC